MTPSPMSALDLVALVGAVAVTYGFFCRLSELQFRRHRSAVVLFHLLGFGASFWSGVDAWSGNATMAHLCSLGAGAMWLTMSLHTWRNGPPPHVSSDWGKLQELQDSAHE